MYNVHIHIHITSENCVQCILKLQWHMDKNVLLYLFLIKQLQISYPIGRPFPSCSRVSLGSSTLPSINKFHTMKFSDFSHVYAFCIVQSLHWMIPNGLYVCISSSKTSNDNAKFRSENEKRREPTAYWINEKWLFF